MKTLTKSEIVEKYRTMNNSDLKTTIVLAKIAKAFYTKFSVFLQMLFVPFFIALIIFTETGNPTMFLVATLIATVVTQLMLKFVYKELESDNKRMSLIVDTLKEMLEAR